MPEQVAAPPRKEIEVATAVSIPDSRAFSADKADIKPSVIRHDVSAEGVDNRSRGGARLTGWCCGTGIKRGHGAAFEKARMGFRGK
jgi:hypothetical protein